MRKFKRFISLVLIFALLLTSLPNMNIVFAAAEEPESKKIEKPITKPDVPSVSAPIKYTDRADREIIVKYKDDSKKNATKNQLKATLKLSKLEAKRSFKKSKAELLEVEVGQNIDTIINELKNDPNVEYVQPNYKLTINTIPTDAKFREQWGLQNIGQEIEGMPGRTGVDINAFNAWNTTTGSASVVVGVLDTGVDINHNDLKSNIFVNTKEIPNNNIDDDKNGYVDDVNGWDFANADKTVYDSSEKDFHGTYIAGIIAAKSDTVGITGIAPNVKVMPLKFINGQTGYTCDAIDAIEYAMQMGVKIINCSFGGTDNNLALKDAMQNSGILFVVAAGNRGGDIYSLPVYPAAFDMPNMLTVAAIDNYGVLAPFSTYGNKIHVAAPGVNIVSSTPDNTYDYFTGTSAAAPFVSGIAALIKSKYPAATIKEITDRIKNNVVVSTSLQDKISTGGRVDAEAALSNVKPTADTYVGPGADVITIPGGDQGGEIDTWYTMDQFAKIKEKLHYGQSGVNPASGNFSFTVTDMSIPAPGFEVNISRTYNSRDNKAYPLGMGWTFGFEGSARGNDLMTVTLPNGGVQRFRKEDTAYRAEDSRSVFVKNADGTYILTTKDQYSYGFDTNGWLVWMKDKNGNTVNITVDAGGKISKITDTVNRDYIITYNGQGLIDNIKDPQDRVVTYKYNTQGRLIQVIDPSGSIMRYSYDAEGYINSIEDHYQKIIEKLTYNHAVGVDQDKVVQATDANGNNNSYAYDATNRKTTIKDQNGRTWTYWFDADMYTIKVQDAEDKISLTEYYLTGGKNVYGDVKWTQDRNGNKTEYEIDDRGNVTKIINPDLSYKQFGYDEKNNKIWEKDELGKATYYVYDAAKINLVKKAQPLNGTDNYITDLDPAKYVIMQYAYYTKTEAQSLFNCNVAGLVKSITDPENNVTEYTYDIHGNTKTVKDPEGKIATSTYNKIGWKLSDMNAKGYRKDYVYDLNGLLEKVVQHNGETTRIDYDLVGRKIKEVSPNQYDAAQDNLAAHTYSGDHGYRYEYFDSGLLQKAIDPNNYVITYTYDMYGNMITETKPNGAVYRYEYDKLDRLVKSYFKEAATAQEVLLEEFSCTILTDGKTQKTHKKYLNETEIAETMYVYDYANRLVEQQNPDGTKSKFNYNPNGTLEVSTAPNGSISYYKYDGLNRLIGKYIPFQLANGTTQYTYEKIDYDKAGKKTAVFNGKELVELNKQPSAMISTSYSYYKNGLLKSTLDSAGRKSEYEYDDDGNVNKEVAYINETSTKITEYLYNHQNKLATKKVHITTGTLVGNEYSNTTDTLLTTTYTYDDNGNLKTVTTPNTAVTTYTYDNMNRQLSVSQPGQNEVGTAVTIINSTTYDWEGKPLTQTDSNGNVTTYAYDKRGQLAKVIDAMQGVSAYSYDRAGRKLIEVSPLNYDALKSLDQQSRVEYVYDIMGRIRAKKDIYYNVKTSEWKTIYTSSYKYDINGNVIKELDALGYESGTGESLEERTDTGYGTQYTYNLVGMVVTTLDAVSKERDLSFTTNYVYDGLGRKTSETNAKEVITVYTYDDAGNVLNVKIKKNSNSQEQVIRQATYDLLGRQKTQTDGNNNVTQFEYNAFDKLSKAVYPGDATIAVNTIIYQYDVMGNLALQQDSLGKVNLYDYDIQNRMLSQKEQKTDDSEAITLSVKYDKNGNKRYETDGNGIVKTNTFDKLNRVKTSSITVNGLPQVTAYDYDANGNQTTVTDWRGNTYTSVYDALNRLIEKKDPYTTIQRLEYNSNSVQAKSYDALGNMTEYQYDKNNRLFKTIDAEGHSISQSYDDVGNVAAKTDGRNITTTYNYDEFNRLKSVVNARLEATSYTYDLNGNLQTQIDGNGHVTTYEYNVRNMVKSKIDHEGRLGLPTKYTYITGKLESYTYYANGNMQKKTDRNDVVTTYVYDIHGRLKSRTADGKTISYTYDDNGNQLTMTDATGTTTRTYDELNRAETKTVPSIGKSTYVYDITTAVEEGFVKETSTDPKINTVAKVYDKAGRLAHVISADGTTTYEYYDNGNRASVIYQNGVREDYTYFKDNLLETLVNKKADGSIIDNYSYAYDAAHNQISKTDAKGITNYTYDSLNRLQSAKEPGGKVTSYTYDKAGNRLTETVSLETVISMTNYAYNEQNRLTSTVTVKGNGLSEKITYNYDDNGNMVSKFNVKLNPEQPTLPGALSIFKAGESNDNSVSFYEYDVWNQLTKTTEGKNTVSYAYNGEGYRVQKNINSQIEKYLYEADKVVLEVDGAGAQLATNVYDTNLVSRTAGNETAYYLYNGHADVVALLGAAGNTMATYYYDAFGNAVETTGDKDNPYRYSGYRYDEETDIYYLKARYYDAKIARFMSEDTYSGSAEDPLSLNLYSYVSNNPIMYWDPTGHMAVTWEGVIIDIDDNELKEYQSHGWSAYEGNAYTENMYNFANIDEMNVAEGSAANIHNGTDASIGTINTGTKSTVTINNHGSIGMISSGEESRTNITNEGVIGVFITGAKSTNEVTNNGAILTIHTGLNNSTKVVGPGSLGYAGGNGKINGQNRTSEAEKAYLRWWDTHPGIEYANDPRYQFMAVASFQNRLMYMEECGVDLSKMTTEQLKHEFELELSDSAAFTLSLVAGSELIAQNLAGKGPELSKNLIEKFKNLFKKGVNKTIIQQFDDVAIKTEHIFSKDHIKNGIMDLGKNQNDILNSFKKVVSSADSNGLLKEGMNQIRTTVNGVEAEIRVFIKDGTVLNMDGFKGYSTRNMGNSINWP
jgi:RHS repeat-associated protein